MKNPVEIVGDWAPLIGDLFATEQMGRLRTILMKEMGQHVVFPPSHEIFNAFQLTSPDQVKVVIIGQDPYHTPNMAHGLAFSVVDHALKDIPPSLRNIFREIENDIGFRPYHDPNLTRWAKQGVLLLNRILTVRQGHALSHANIGWEFFTEHVIRRLSAYRKQPIVFMLWGKTAQQCGSFVTAPHHVLMAPHPSPLSAHQGFFKCRHFSECNTFLKLNDIEPIKWIE